MVVTDGLHRVTGALTPDVTGDYLPNGIYNAKMSYQLVGNGWFIWWDAVDRWTISNTKGISAGNWWHRIDPDIEGAYVPQGTAVGIPTVTEI